MITEGMTIMSTDLDRTIALNSGWARILPQFCFAIASFTAVVGVSLGIYMGISQDHLLAPVHVHLNLIGWVSMFLFGVYYKLHPEILGKAAAIQAGVTAIGYISMMGALAGMLLRGRETLLPVAIMGSLMVWTGVVMFFIIVARNTRASY
jgi:hypothetical protein